MKKSLVFDFTNLVKRVLFSSHVKLSETEVDYDVWMWTVFNSINMMLMKVKPDECVLACDNSSWRKLVYKPYKLDRKIKKEKRDAEGLPDIDWNFFYSQLNQYTLTLKNHLPFKIIDVQSAEADDIIGVLCLTEKNKEFTIVSVDQDYLQLLNNKNIKIYEPLKKEYRKCEDPEKLILEYCIDGQAKDNIYNVLTPLDFPLKPVLGENGEEYSFRKPSLGNKKLNEILNVVGLDNWLDNVGPKEALKKNDIISEENKKRLDLGQAPKPLLNTELRKRFELNKKIIDFREIPKVLVSRIIDQYNGYEKPDPDNIYKFFKEKRWPSVMENYSQVEDRLMKLY